MSGENSQDKKNKDEKSLSFRYPSKQTTIKLCFAILVILFIGKTCYIKSAPIDTKTKSIQNETIKDTDKKTILNISNLPIVKYKDCIENGMYKISQRDARREFTHVASFSPKEFVFINGYYHFGANKANTASAKQEKINRIEKYNITNDKYSKILELPKAKIRMDKIPFDEKNLLFRDGARLYSYNLPKNKLVLICDNFDYFMLFPYQNNEFLLNKNDNLYVLNTQTKEIKFLKKLTISLNPPLFKINDDLFICISGNSGKTKSIIYSIKQNKIYDELDISEINTVEKISDDKLLIIETLKQNVDVQKNQH